MIGSVQEDLSLDEAIQFGEFQERLEQIFLESISDWHLSPWWISILLILRQWARDFRSHRVSSCYFTLACRTYPGRAS